MIKSSDSKLKRLKSLDTLATQENSIIKSAHESVKVTTVVLAIETLARKLQKRLKKEELKIKKSGN